MKRTLLAAVLALALIAPAIGRGAAARPGADGIGDPYFPQATATAATTSPTTTSNLALHAEDAAC